MPENATPILANLLKALAVECDLHYDDDDAPALTETLEVMKPAADILLAAGVPLPETYMHVLLRFGGTASA